MVSLQKMPTIAVYQDGKKVKQHIAAETGSSSVEKVGHLLCFPCSLRNLSDSLLSRETGMQTDL